MQGKKVGIKQFEKFDATVLWFISPECPLCQSYTLSIKKLQAKYGKGIRILGIVSGKNYELKEIENFKKEYAIQIEILLDEEKKLSKYLGASITPEVFVYNKNQSLVYSGRIDNWAYAPGKKRSVITKHELSDVLEMLHQQKDVKYFKTQAVGCFIE